MATLRKGLRGEPVRRLQAALGVGVDGIFGPGTERALRAYQESNGLSVDGIAGPDTFSAMGLHELVLLKKGQRGQTVKRLQEALGTGADGIFGSGTAAAVMRYQQENGLVADGIAGPATLASMDLFSEFSEDVVEMSMVPDNYQDPVPPQDWVTSDEAMATSEAATAELAPEEQESKGVWGTVKGWFS